MKKGILFAFLLAIACMIGMSGCKGCSDNGSEEQVENMFSTDYDGVLPDLSKGAEYIIALHRQTMNVLADGDNYAWYETKFTFADSLKQETLADAVVKEVTDVFQTFHPEQCYTITTNAARGTMIPAPTPGLWIEDFDLGYSDVKLSIADVLMRLAQVNMPLPPSVSIILRKPVGPVQCNAQYVMGNPFETVWVDAVTGDVTNSCPAYPKGLAKPTSIR